MQSYLDVSLILVMAVAVFILTLMLIFFLTLSRRIKKLTLENQKLKNALDKEIIENKTRNEDYLKNGIKRVVNDFKEPTVVIK